MDTILKEMQLKKKTTELRVQFNKFCWNKEIRRLPDGSA